MHFKQNLLAKKKISALLIAPNLAKSHGTRAIAVGLLGFDDPNARRTTLDSLRGQGPARGLATLAFLGGCVSACHFQACVLWFVFLGFGDRLYRRFFFSKKKVFF